MDFVEQVTHDPNMDRVQSKSVAPRSPPKNIEQEKSIESQKGVASSAKAPEPVGDPAAVARESDLFFVSVIKLIDARKIYPKEALQRELEGKVIVAVTLDRDGSLMNLEIESPSPFEILNQAALKAVQSVEKFPEVPAIIPAPIHLHIPLAYRIARH